MPPSVVPEAGTRVADPDPPVAEIVTEEEVLDSVTFSPANMVRLAVSRAMACTRVLSMEITPL